MSLGWRAAVRRGFEVFCGQAQASPHISSLNLPVRVLNILLAAGITTTSELSYMRVSNLRKIKGLGDVYCAEIERVMVERGLWR